MTTQTSGQTVVWNLAFILMLRSLVRGFVFMPLLASLMTSGGDTQDLDGRFDCSSHVILALEAFSGVDVWVGNLNVLNWVARMRGRANKGPPRSFVKDGVFSPPYTLCFGM